MDPRIETSVSLKDLLGVTDLQLGALKEFTCFKCSTIMNKDAKCPFKGEPHSGNCLYLVENDEGRVVIKCHCKKHGCNNKYLEVLPRRPRPFSFVGLDNK